MAVLIALGALSFAADPPAPTAVTVTLADAAVAELVAGARITLAETHDGPERETLAVVPACAEVKAARPVGARTEVELLVGEADAAALRAIPSGAVVRAAVCPSPATPTSRALTEPLRAAALPASVPADWLALLRPGDAVDVLVSLPAGGGRVDETITLLRGVPLVAPGIVALQPAQLERFAHAVDGGRVAVAVERTEGVEESGEHLASQVPRGLRFVAAPLPPAAGAAPFARPADYVDATAWCAGTSATILQAAFVLPAGPGDRTTIALVTPDQAERWVHAAAFCTVALSLRNDADVAFVEEPAKATTELPPAPRTAWDPVYLSTRIAKGMRGLAVPLASGVRPTVGALVDVVAVDAAGVASPVLKQRVVLAVDPAPGGATTALLHVTPADVLLAVAARGPGRTLQAR